MRAAGIAAVLFVVSFTACAASDAGKVKQFKGELPIAPAFLRKQLPTQVVTYARIPNLLGLFAMPKNNQLDAALRSEANINNVKGIQQGLVQNVLALPTFSDPRLKFLADAVRSPIEVAGFGMPNPAVLIGATLSVRSKADFNKLFEELGRTGPSVPDGVREVRRLHRTHAAVCGAKAGSRSVRPAAREPAGGRQGPSDVRARTEDRRQRPGHVPVG
jgi:hypothetical protein